MENYNKQKGRAIMETIQPPSQEDVSYTFVKLHAYALPPTSNDEPPVFTEIDNAMWKNNLKLEELARAYDLSLPTFNFDVAIMRFVTFAYRSSQPDRVGVAIQSYYDKQHNKKLAKQVALKNLNENPLFPSTEIILNNPQAKRLHKKLKNLINAKVIYELLEVYSINLLLDRHLSRDHKKLYLEVQFPNWV